MALASTCFIHAQDYQDICATPDPTVPDNSPYYSNSTDFNVLQAIEPAVINVRFWKVNAPNGYHGENPLTEQIALETIQYLNINFNPIGIYFKYRGLEDYNSPADVDWKRYNYECSGCKNFPFNAPDPNNPCVIPNITNDPDGYGKLSQCQRGSLYIDAEQAGAYAADALNIYVPYELVDFGGAAGANGSNIVVVSTAGLLKNILLHEIGHCFKLRHTHSGWWSSDPNYTGCEHVTRDPNDLNYNADDAGDRITDTAAMPEFMREYCFVNNLDPALCSPANQQNRWYYYDQGDCEYDGLLQNPPRDDCQGTPYQIDAVQSRNTMSYAPGDCKDNFTIGQGIKMKEALANEAVLQPIKTTIASLYEPYKGDYYLAGPVPQSPNPPLFQPGFTYRFVECECDPSCPEPSPYEDTSFSYGGNALLTILKDETDFSAITHPNHTAIQIDFVNPLPDSYGQNTRRCYDNWNKAAIDGSVTRFNDGVLNTNITILPQDSTAINDPALINTLNPGLYKIEKNYNDGATKQTIVVKENNE